ncbi:hypothetical protein CSE16_19910 [Solibacillus sp. R5-41]|uniref:hypothetical protein n=1 Tax=Solibacillus sp. R5-41 TaxID=2048654 RepID=UPI000C124867|nr:hypothetical protein [Solibacillus sp. R5-41]ATP42095.1 hypothetical protein CSE16_19910 [Solibacillus sp. R5-41]
MAQAETSKEVSGKKMATVIIGTIIIASVVIVIVILAFYMLWEPKKKIEKQDDETKEPSYTKSAIHHYEQLIKIS